MNLFLAGDLNSETDQNCITGGEKAGGEGKFVHISIAHKF